MSSMYKILSIHHTPRHMTYVGLHLADQTLLSTYPQCRIKVGAIDAAALGPFLKRPTATERTRIFFCI